VEYPKEDFMRVFHRRQRAFMVAGVAGLISIAAIGSVAARTAPPSIGRAVSFGNEGCFHLFFSRVLNACAAPADYEIPLNTDNAGSKTVGVNVHSNGLNGVCCDAVGTDERLEFQFRSVRVCTNLTGNQTLTLTGGSIPSRGRMFVGCTLQPGGIINTVNWNQ
jgi:hypothetical protein